MRDTSLNLSRESGRLALIAADPLVNAFDRDNANRSSQVIAEQAAEFQSFKTEQGWAYPAAVNYQVGNRALTSSSAGLVDIANPTSFLGGLKAGIQQWMAAVNTAGAQNVQTLKDNGVELSDVDAFIAAVDKIKSAVLKNFVQTPDYFKNGPGSLLDPTKPLNPLDWEKKSMGERLFSKGLGSTIAVDTAMCRLIFSKQDGLELMQQFGLVDAEFLRQMDSLSADIVLAVPRQIFDRVFATDIAINQLATTGALSQFDSQIQATEAQMGSANGFQDVYASSLKGLSLDAFDGAVMGSNSFVVAAEQLRMNSTESGQNSVLLASLELGDITVSDAGPGWSPFQLTSIESVNGQPPVASTSAIANAALAEQGFDLRDVVLTPGRITPYVEAIDATNADGTTASLVQVTGRTDWWNDPAVIDLASSGTSLISLLRGGTPLAIATNGVNFASHVFTDPAVAQIAFALSGISNLAGLVTALEKGDLGRILIDGGGVARTAMTIYSNTLQQEMISRFGSVFRAGELAGNGNAAAAAEFYNKGLGAAITAIDTAAANDSAWTKAA